MILLIYAMFLYDVCSYNCKGKIHLRINLLLHTQPIPPKKKLIKIKGDWGIILFARGSEAYIFDDFTM